MDEHQYFPEDLIRLGPEEFFLDAGAFTGDTVQSILAHTGGRFGAIHSFEPDRLSHAKLCDQVAALPPEQRLRIQCHRMALSMEARQALFPSTGSSSGNLFQPDGLETVDVVNIHNVLPQEVLDRLSFIKMDVEGSEMEVLRSLEAEIRAQHPILAVCVYHRDEDLTEIPAFVHTLYPDYRLFLRHHSNCRCETVLYAIPPERVIGNPG
ncbi:FkbM family methyltransferase [Holophaga foetida]|uniref:FkbM family methyltransferase n=1 Tax=Holophaga foetida TaxID=35839 RepID=UPI0002EC63AB|nr:FkbM family methyltransferase [Holophaga foetida]